MATKIEPEVTPVICIFCGESVEIGTPGTGALGGRALHMTCYRRQHPNGHLAVDRAAGIEREATKAEGADRGVCPRCDQPGEIVRVADVEHIVCHGCRTRWRNRGEAVTAPISMAQSAKNARVIEEYQKVEPKIRTAWDGHGHSIKT